MIRHARLAVVVLCAALASACGRPAPLPPASNSEADIAAIGKARQAFAVAYSAGDAEAIGRLYTADAVSEPNHQATLTGREAIVDSLESMFEQVSVKAELISEETKVQGSAGFDRGHYKAEVTSKTGGAASTVEGRYFVLYSKGDDGQWRVARDFDNSALPMRPPAAAQEKPATN